MTKANGLQSLAQSGGSILVRKETTAIDRETGHKKTIVEVSLAEDAAFYAEGAGDIGTEDRGTRRRWRNNNGGGNKGVPKQIHVASWYDNNKRATLIYGCDDACGGGKCGMSGIRALVARSGGENGGCGGSCGNKKKARAGKSGNRFRCATPLVFDASSCAVFLFAVYS